MSWQHEIVIALFVFNALASVVMVGQERKPTTPGMAATIVAIDQRIGMGHKGGPCTRR